MIYPTISDINANKIVESRRAGQDYRVTDSDIEYVGDSGESWDGSHIAKLAKDLTALQNSVHESGYGTPERNRFDRVACQIIHSDLKAPPYMIADAGFWRWLAVDKLYPVIENRHKTRSRPAGLNNFGITASATYNRLFILYLRAEIVYDDEADDPYHLSRTLSPTDFWESGIIRHRYGWAPSLARAFVRFQYPDPESGKGTLNLTHDNGIRQLYKTLRRLHATIAFEYLTVQEIVEILEERSANLERA